MYGSFIPMDIEVTHDDLLETLIVEGVMNRDFAFWRKGDRHVLTFNFDKGTVSEYGESGDLIRATSIALVPAGESLEDK